MQTVLHPTIRKTGAYLGAPVLSTISTVDRRKGEPNGSPFFSLSLQGSSGHYDVKAQSTRVCQIAYNINRAYLAL